MDIFQHLAKEHRQVSELMDRVSTSRDKDAKMRIFLEMREELLTHAKAEERTFYEALEDYDELSDKIKHARKEHKRIEELMVRLSGMDAGQLEWDEVFQELKECVEHHVREEEGEVFRLARGILDVDESDDITRVMQREEESVRASL